MKELEKLPNKNRVERELEQVAQTHEVEQALAIAEAQLEKQRQQIHVREMHLQSKVQMFKTWAMLGKTVAFIVATIALGETYCWIRGYIIGLFS